MTNESLPESWYSQIEKSKEKARKFLKKVIAVDLNDSILVGVLNDVSLDKLFRLKYPFCKLTLIKAKKYSLDGKLEKQIEGEQICFVNKPQMIMDMEELSKKFPEIHEDIHVDLRRGRFG
ncbi:MAG: hypothetical protein QXK49_02465 [Candidatus Aenigmatarchaeota archaeon]